MSQLEVFSCDQTVVLVPDGFDQWRSYLVNVARTLLRATANDMTTPFATYQTIETVETSPNGAKSYTYKQKLLQYNDKEDMVPGLLVVDSYLAEWKQPVPVTRDMEERFLYIGMMGLLKLLSVTTAESVSAMSPGEAYDVIMTYRWLRPLDQMNRGMSDLSSTLLRVFQAAVQSDEHVTFLHVSTT